MIHVNGCWTIHVWVHFQSVKTDRFLETLWKSLSAVYMHASALPYGSMALSEFTGYSGCTEGILFAMFPVHFQTGMYQQATLHFGLLRVQWMVNHLLDCTQKLGLTIWTLRWYQCRALDDNVQCSSDCRQLKMFWVHGPPSNYCKSMIMSKNWQFFSFVTHFTPYISYVKSHTV